MCQKKPQPQPMQCWRDFGAHEPHSLSYDGSAKKTGGGQHTDEGGRSESTGTLTGTRLIMAHTHQELRIDPNGKDITNTINRAELIGVLLWLVEVMRDGLATGRTVKLLKDSQVTLPSILKAIK